MQINHSPFPLLSHSPADVGRRNQPGQVEQREQDIRHQRQPTEHIFQGELEDDGFDTQSARQVFSDSVHPLNRGAVLSYATTASASFGQPERLGRHLDLFL